MFICARKILDISYAFFPKENNWYEYYNADLLVDHCKLCSKPRNVKFNFKTCK